LWLSVIAYNLGNLWRQLALPKKIGNRSVTSLQHRLVKIGGRLVKHARYYWLLLAEGAPEPKAVRQHGEDDRGAGAAGRVANRERQRIERSEGTQPGQVSAARQVGSEKQTKQVSETVKQAAMRPEGGYVNRKLSIGQLSIGNLTREGGRRTVFAQRQD
jgi:hypothetical protein